MPHLNLFLTPNLQAVREGVTTVRDWAEAAGVGPGCSGMIELVLAECLNNVVEHALADVEHGWIALEVGMKGDCFSAQIRDPGKEMPGRQVPQGRIADPGQFETGDLPEGGWGWGLIRSQCRALTYRRDGAENLLDIEMTLEFDCASPAEPTELAQSA